ncbi:MAG: uracil-DNA glycosylase [Thermoplasmata archaeon]
MAGAVGSEWEELSREIRGCVLCPLHVGRTHAVVYRGGEHPWVVFIGEAPGVLEDRTGEPFVGRAGRTLDRAIARLGLEPAEFGIINVLKCRPPENRFVIAAARTCRPYLDRQLVLLNPRAVVPLGRWALQTMDPGAPPIMTAAGTERSAGSWSLFPLLHPSAIRSRASAERWARDLGTLAGWLEERRR